METSKVYKVVVDKTNICENLGEKCLLINVKKEYEYIKSI